MTKIENPYNSMSPKNTRAFNTDAGSFTGTAHEVTEAELEQALANRAKLVEKTKKRLRNENN